MLKDNNHNNKERKTAVIYARVSSQGDRQSTARQVEDLKEYAAGNSLEVVRTFEEHVSGAVANTDRAVLRECLDFCFGAGVDTLLVSELSRLGRNAFGILENVRLCREKGLNIHFQKERMDIFQADGTANPYLAVMVSVLGTCAEMERENIRFRLNSGRARYVAAGGRLGRRQGTVMTREQMADKYKAVIRELRRGTSVRRAAKLCDVSPSTVQRVKKTFGL